MGCSWQESRRSCRCRTSMLFKFTSEHKLLIAVVTFVDFQFLTVFMESPCTRSVDDFLALMTFVDNFAMINLMVGVKVLHGIECDVGKGTTLYPAFHIGFMLLPMQDMLSHLECVPLLSEKLRWMSTYGPPF